MEKFIPMEKPRDSNHARVVFIDDGTEQPSRLHDKVSLTFKSFLPRKSKYGKVR